MVAPLRKGDKQRAKLFREIIKDSPGVEYRPITDDILERAASLRAELGLRTPDAILAATCFLADCAVFVTNDARLKRLTGIRTVLLSEAAESAGSA